MTLDEEEMQKEIDEFVDMYLNQILPVIFENELVKKQQEIQERIAIALERLVDVKLQKNGQRPVYLHKPITY